MRVPSPPLTNGHDKTRRLPKELLKRASHLVRAYRLIWEASRGWTVAWGLLILLQGLVPAATVYLAKVLVDALTEALGGGFSWEMAGPVVVAAALVGGAMLLSQVLQSLSTWVRTGQTELVGDHIKGLVHEQAGTIDLEYYETPAYFDQMARANGQAESRAGSLLQNVGGLLQHATSLVAIAFLLIPYGAWLPVALLLSTLPGLWAVVHHQRRYHDWWQETTQKRRWAQYYDTVLTGQFFAPEVRVFGLNRRFAEAYIELRKTLRGGLLRLLRAQSFAQFGASFAALLVTAATIGWVGWRALQGTATLGDLALFYQAFSQGQALMRSSLSSAGHLYSDALFLEHLFSFLELEPKVTSPERPAPVQLRKGIEIEDVRFRYPGSERLALRGMTLSIPAGKIVAVVGPNGAGKSTLVKLLCRFYDPVSGRVLFDGTDIRDADPQDLRRRITALFQHHVNYAGTVAENVTMGDAEGGPSFERLVAAAEAGGAAEVVARLPQEYRTMLGKQFEGGVDLSGGEFQRLALSRALYRPAPLIILDEPTSFMDPWTEAAWLDQFCEHVQGRTVLLVTHRFSTAMRADLICVMDEGRVVESGTHHELLRKDGLYAASWRTQAQARANAELSLPVA